MPYKNMPKKHWGKMERCVRELQRKGGVENPYAVCYESIMGKKKKKK